MLPLTCCPAWGLGAGLLCRCSCSTVLGAEWGSPRRGPAIAARALRAGAQSVQLPDGPAARAEPLTESPAGKKVWKLRSGN